MEARAVERAHPGQDRALLMPVNRSRTRRDAPLISFYNALNDPALFRPWFEGPSWDRWRVWAKAVEGLPMTTAELEIFQHHTGRQTPPTLPATEMWNVSARRTGKSLISAARAAHAAVFRDYRPYLKPGERALVMVIAADRDQAGVVFRYIEGFFGHVPLLAPLVESRTKESIELTNGVTITVQTASFRRIRGRTVVCVILDEVAFWMDDQTSANPAREIIAAIRPSTATIPHALLIAISSPYARQGVLWDAFRTHYGKDDSPVFVWKGTALEMNTTLDPRVIEEAYASDPAAARAEWGSEFRSDIETYLAAEWIDAVVVPGRHELPPRDGVRYLAATDPSGGAGGDSFTWAICHVEGADGQRKVVLDLLRGHRPRGGETDLESVVREIAATLRRYHVSTIFGDRYAAQWIVEAFKREGIRYEEPRLRVLNDLDAEPKYVDKSTAYSELEPLIATGRVELLDHDVLVRELRGLERRLRAGGKALVDHAPGAHDDFANSVALVIVLAARQRIRPMVYSPVPQIGERIGERRTDGGGQTGPAAGGVGAGQAAFVRRWYR